MGKSHSRASDDVRAESNQVLNYLESEFSAAYLRRLEELNVMVQTDVGEKTFGEPLSKISEVLGQLIQRD